MATGSADGSIRLWTTNPLLEGEIQMEPSDEKRKFPQKLDQKSAVLTKHAISVFVGHHQSISSVSWTSPECIVSASLDHTIRLWDPSVGSAKQTIQTESAITSMSVNPINQHILTSHADRSICIWDNRLQGNF